MSQALSLSGGHSFSLKLFSYVTVSLSHYLIEDKNLVIEMIQLQYYWSIDSNTSGYFNWDIMNYKTGAQVYFTLLIIS